MEEQATVQWSDRDHLPVAVVVATGSDGKVEVQGVVAGKRFASAERSVTRMRSGPEGTLDLWSGYRLRLHKDQAEAYYLNIRADAPTIFVIGRHEPEGFAPQVVTVSLDEAQNLDATELRDPRDAIFRVAMPGEIYRWVEAFVLNHYEPRRKGGKGRGKRRSRAAYDAEVGDYAGPGEGQQ